MADPIIQIQARLGSTRLPGKVLLHLGEQRVLDWVIERGQCAEYTAKTVVAVGDAPENEAIIEWCERVGATSYQGPEDNLLERHRKTAHEVGADPVVRLTGDCPFVPPREIDRMVQEHAINEAQYTTNVVGSMPVGTAVDVIDRDLLDELAEHGDEHPVRRLRDSPNEWNAAFSPAHPWMEFSSAHVAVDTPADYWTLTDAIETVGSYPLTVIREVAREDI